MASLLRWPVKRRNASSAGKLNRDEKWSEDCVSALALAHELNSAAVISGAEISPVIAGVEVASRAVTDVVRQHGIV